MTGKPAALRWWILLLLFLSMTVNFLDRQVLSLVAPVLRDQLGLSNTQYGTIVFCFLLGMTLGQIPAGILMDRKGARAGFTFIVAWWSVANMLHAFGRSMAQLASLRFLLGLGECGTWPRGRPGRREGHRAVVPGPGARPGRGHFQQRIAGRRHRGASPDRFPDAEIRLARGISDSKRRGFAVAGPVAVAVPTPYRARSG